MTEQSIRAAVKRIDRTLAEYNDVLGRAAVLLSKAGRQMNRLGTENTGRLGHIHVDLWGDATLVAQLGLTDGQLHQLGHEGALKAAYEKTGIAREDVVGKVLTETLEPPRAPAKSGRDFGR